MRRMKNPAPTLISSAPPGSDTWSRARWRLHLMKRAIIDGRDTCPFEPLRGHALKREPIRAPYEPADEDPAK